MISPLCRGLDAGRLEVSLFLPRHGEEAGEEELMSFTANCERLVGEPAPWTVG